MRRSIFALAFFITATAANANSLIAANTPTNVARSDLRITPDRDWNKLSLLSSRNVETWTLDGHQLNAITYFGGIANDATLMREVDRRNRPLPHFNSTSLPSDIPALFESTYRIARSVTVFNLGTQEPANFAGTTGVHFTYDFVGAEELQYRGEAFAAIIDGKLYMATYEAPAIHFFDAGVGSFRSMVTTAVRAPATRR